MKVSVITPCFNCSHLIKRAVESVALQRHESLEHILIDDGSTDGTLEVLEELKHSYSHIRVLSQPNGGAAKARNIGIQKAKGRFIAFLDADDYWLEGKLKAQLAFMETAGVVFSYGDYYIETEGKGRVTFSAPKEVDFQDLLAECSIGCLTVCYDSAKIGKFLMPDVRRGQDWALWLKITQKGIIARKYPGLNAVYTVNKHSLSSSKLKKARNIYSIYRNVTNFSSVRSAYLTLRHSFNVLYRRKRS